MPTPKQKERNDRMHQAALGEFSQHGFHQANVDVIALKAGVSKATLYSHFETKEALFLAIFEKVLKEAVKPPSKPIKSTGLAGAFRRGLRKFLTNVASTPETRFFFQCMTSGSEIIRDDLRNELTERFTSILIGEFKEFQAAQKEGLIYSHFNLKIVQQAIVGILLQILRYWLEQEKTISIKHLSDQLSSLLLFGLAVPDKAGILKTKTRSKFEKTKP